MEWKNWIKICSSNTEMSFTMNYKGMLALVLKLVKALQDMVTPAVCLSTQDGCTASDHLAHAPFYHSA